MDWGSITTLGVLGVGAFILYRIKSSSAPPVDWTKIEPPTIDLHPDSNYTITEHVRLDNGQLMRITRPVSQKQFIEYMKKHPEMRVTSSRNCSVM